MSASGFERSDADRLWTEYLRVSEVRDLLHDMSEAAWVSMENKDFGDSDGEHSKLDYLKSVRGSASEDAAQAWRRWVDAEFGRDPEQAIQARAAQCRQGTQPRRARSRGIERSR